MRSSAGQMNSSSFFKWATCSRAHPGKQPVSQSVKSLSLLFEQKFNFSNRFSQKLAAFSLKQYILRLKNKTKKQ